VWHFAPTWLTRPYTTLPHKGSLFYVIHSAGHVPLLLQIDVGCTHFSSISAPDVTFYSSCLTKLPGFPAAHIHVDRPVYWTELCWWNWKHYMTIFVRQYVLACLTSTKSIAQVQLVANEAATMLNLLFRHKKNNKKPHMTVGGVWAVAMSR